MYPPTTLTVNTASQSFSINIPAGSNYSDFVESIHQAGGVWTPQTPNQGSSAVQTFILWEDITAISAQ